MNLGEAGARTEHIVLMDAVKRRLRRIVRAAAKIEPPLGDAEGVPNVSAHSFRRTGRGL